jgi:hypothetical protein
MLKQLILFSCLIIIVHVINAKNDPVKLPFSNLTYPIKNVSDCWTYSQTLANNSHLGKPVCPSTDIVFYTDSQKPVFPVVDGIVAGVHSVFGTWLVVVKHKEYYFSYFGLSRAFVNKGDSVCNEIAIGQTSFDENRNKYTVGLQIDTELGTWNPETIFNYCEEE